MGTDASRMIPGECAVAQQIQSLARVGRLYVGGNGHWRSRLAPVVRAHCLQRHGSEFSSDLGSRSFYPAGFALPRANSPFLVAHYSRNLSVALVSDFLDLHR